MESAPPSGPARSREELVTQNRLVGFVFFVLGFFLGGGRRADIFIFFKISHLKTTISSQII